MILLSLIKKLFLKITPTGVKPNLNFLEEEAEKVYLNQKEWEKEIEDKIKNLSEEEKKEIAEIMEEIKQELSKKE